MPKAELRLVPGGRAGDGGLLAGIEIVMGPGTKTYWRTPGDSGVPPQFVWDGSINVGHIEVLFPAPHRFSDGAGTSIGYAERVVLPVTVQPADPSRPVELKLSADFAICEKLCVPMSAKARMVIDGRADDGAVASAMLQVPRQVVLGAGKPTIVSCRIDHEQQPARIEALAAVGSGPADLFVEGPSNSYALPVPEQAGPPLDGRQRFSFTFEGVPGGVRAGSVPLRLTLVTPDGAIETQACLDPAHSSTK